jgi:hypothetical protein
MLKASFLVPCFLACFFLEFSAFCAEVAPESDVGTLIRGRLAQNQLTTWKQDSEVGGAHWRLFVEDTPKQKRWMVVARFSEMAMEARMFQNGKRRTVSAQSPDCKIAVNAGYFNVNTGASTSLVVENGEITGRDERAISRPQGVGYPTRSVLGRSGGVWKMRWGRTASNEVHSFLNPGDPWQAPKSGNVWNLDNAVGGGPMVVFDGKKRVTAEEELFDAQSGVDPNGFHGRTAVGLDSTGLVFLFVSDGRRANAVGSSMSDIANIMLGFGARYAMNLDGGGSSTMVVEGEVLNSPSDGVERPVVSVLCLK